VVAGNLGRDGVRGGSWQRRGESRVAAIGGWRARRDAGLVAAHAEGVACYHSAGLAPRLAPRRPSVPVHTLALVSPKIFSKDPIAVDAIFLSSLGSISIFFKGTGF
jgi:hypothetical protein